MGKDVFCWNFILCAVATFWAMSLVRIYPARALISLVLILAQKTQILLPTLFIVAGD